jgi:BirA family biotin operon repressor/biotin-[acetyl-CoA-carboxylase] ligase
MIIPAAGAAFAKKAWPLPAGVAFEWHDEIDSTSSELMRRARAGELDSGAGAALVLAAGAQTAGRGRQGRLWVSGGAGASLMLSLAYPFAAAQPLAGLSLAMGVAAAQALNRVCGQDVIQLKWPNDLLLRQPSLAGRYGKLGGILVESTACGRDSARRWAVVGIGINLRGHAGLVGLCGAGVTAAALDAAWPGEPQLHDIGPLVATALADALSRFTHEGFAAFRDDWQALHAWQGQRVCAVSVQGEELCCGIAMGVSDSGALQIDVQGGAASQSPSVSIESAEVSLRLCEPHDA